MNKNYSNKKGLSAVVVTLILVLLAIVAVGVVWAVVNGILQTSSGQIGQGTACLDISVSATNVVAGASAGTYDVTLKRTSTGGDLEGVKMTIFNNTGNSPVKDVPGNIAPLETKTLTAISFDNSTGLANKIEVTPYLNQGGTNTSCSTSIFNF